MVETGPSAKKKIKRWSFADQRRLLEIAATSKSFEEMVKRAGRKPHSVRKMAVKLGIGLKAKDN
jgi:hypothetical protein